MPFTLLNRVINPLVRLLIRSPLHPLVSRRIALITFTGRRSGRRYTIPVGYQIAGTRLTITVGSPERKVWWRNLRGTGAPVELVVRGHPRSGRAVATRSGPRAVVSVALDP
jgi:F420H(2)-dependent quinone reductase